ncbi:acyltransferase family protein [Streptomyces phyllanthi]|uniref:Acetyltransferase n=1 Tax=Streptomyces phyllanthi TaxID=1803180 RepID=A0A5N8W2F2_9ACTN|nr:acyltransferase family protein [Streptomyces phyllanthi]MPY41670.1 acetyltransferase [Streptomyces phyllanthi]
MNNTRTLVRDGRTLVMRRPADHELTPARPSSYLHGLDGVRAMAVVLVVVYHVAPSWLPGGFLGVDVFFVLSGYLITDLLCAERQRTGRIALGQFWIRRARRLLPALVTLLVTVTAVAALWRPERIDTSGRDVLSALTFTNNWWQISTDASYFASFGPPPLFQHLWTLGVEEQFYLAWPLVILSLLWMTRSRVRSRARVAVVLAGAIVSLTAMALMHRPGEDASRVYFGTDTHAFGLLLGAALALAVPSAHAWKHRWARFVCGAAGVLGWVVLGGLAGGLHSDSGYLYPWGFAAAACAAGAVVVSASRAGSVFATLLGASWLRWIGRRSYGIYLWHLPLIALALPDGHTAAQATRNALAAALLSLPVAAASYRWVEEPLRRSRPRDGHGSSRLPRAMVALAVPAVIVAVWGLKTADGGNNAADQIAAGQRAVHSAQTPSPAASPHPHAKRITALGDSVMLASAPALKERFPGIVIDAKVSRQLAVAPDEVRSLSEAGHLNQILLIGLGTNGLGGRQELEQVVKAAGPRTVVLVTVHGPVTWKDRVNTAIRQTAEAHSNVVVADWDRAIQGKDDLLADDGIHPGPTAAKLYAKTVAQALKRR